MTFVVGCNLAEWRPDLAAAAGCTSSRITVRMAKVYPTRESYEQGRPEWEQYDQWIDRARAEGLDVLVLCSTVPAWAGGGESGTSIDGRWRPAWADFVLGTMKRYRPQGAQFEAGPNEPDLPSGTGHGVGWEECLPFTSSGALTGPPMSSRPGWRTALRYREMRRWLWPYSISFHANAEGASLSKVFKRIRLHRAMCKLFAKYDTTKRPFYVTEAGMWNLDERWPDLLTLLGTLEAAGCSGCWVYQLTGQGDGDGLYTTGETALMEPPLVPVNEELHHSLRMRTWPVGVDDRDVEPRTVDYVRAVCFLAWGLLQRAVGRR